MLLSQRPLTGSTPDAGLFVGREVELTRALRSVARGQNVLVTGRRREGKTSFLYALADRLRSEGHEVHWVDAQSAASGPLGLTTSIIDAIPGISRGGTKAFSLAMGLTDRSPEPSGPLSERDVRPLLGVADENPVRVVIIDDLPGVAGHDLFGRFRDLVWRAPICWIAATSDDRAWQPPADVFWESRVALAGLSAAEVDELISLRVRSAHEADPDVPVVERSRERLVAEYSGRGPGEVIAAMHAEVDDQIEAVVPNDPQRLELARRVGGASAAATLDALENLGRPVHAGDEEFLGAVRVGRARASQLLNGLEDAGLVRSFDRSRRKMYEPVPLP